MMNDVQINLDHTQCEDIEVKKCTYALERDLDSLVEMDEVIDRGGEGTLQPPEAELDGLHL